MPSELTVDEVRELLDALGQATEFQSAIGGKILTARTLAALCRHFLDSQQSREEIASEAVREFAETVCKSQPCAPGFQGTVRALAAARGVTLDEAESV